MIERQENTFHQIIVTRDRSGLGGYRAASLIKKAIRTTLAAEGVDVPCIVSVILTDDEGIREINRTQREVDRATDVLSFPMNEFVPGGFDPEGAETDPDSGRVFLGDMVISLERAEEQGYEFGHGVEREVGYLAIHSVLHLLGYDHVDEDEGKKRMREHEEYVCMLLGLER